VLSDLRSPDWDSDSDGPKSRPACPDPVFGFRFWFRFGFKVGFGFEPGVRRARGQGSQNDGEDGK
jgi:hypothetical protein